MGIFNSGTKFNEDTRKKIKGLEKVIVEMNKSIKIIGQNENMCRVDAARELAAASRLGGIFESVHLERKKTAEDYANHHASLRQILAKELGFIQGLQEKHIQALEGQKD